MRRIRFAGVVVATASCIGALAAPASADAPPNYGTCVKSGFVDPSAGVIGPGNFLALSRSGGQGGIAVTAWEKSDGQSRFAIASGCEG